MKNNYIENIMKTHLDGSENFGEKIRRRVKKIMRTIAILIVVAVIPISVLFFANWCLESQKGKYQMVYKVYWNSTNVKEYTINDTYPIHYYSRDGYNRIVDGDGATVIETTAPIEIVKYVKFK